MGSCLASAPKEGRSSPWSVSSIVSVLVVRVTQTPGRSPGTVVSTVVTVFLIMVM